MGQQTRRTFLQRASAGAATAALAAATKAHAADRRLRHAVIGVGGQGTSHARAFSAAENCDLVMVCDVDPRHLENVLEKVSDPTHIRETMDYWEVLKDPSIDSVSVTTPDHWHTKIAIEALQAGKHVYVEKPCCHNIYEGIQLQRAAEKYGKCVQHGTHSRGSAGIQEAVAFLREGSLGKIRLAKAINHQMRGPIGRASVEEPPSGVDYDRWQGPASVHPFTQNRWHYNWHWFWEYGGGDMVNDGIHQVDQARWGLGVDLPKAVSASGGQLFYEDDHETPDTQVVTFEYDDCYLMYEMRLWTDYKMEGHDNGVIFYGDNGRMEIGRQGCFVHFTGKEPERLSDGADFGANVRNFIDAALANDPSKLMAPIDEGVTSSALCHMGNIATRVGKRLMFDATTWRFNDDAANALIRRSYREGYELPELA